MNTPTDYVIGFSAGASACVYIFRQVFAFTKEMRKPQNGASGEKPVSFWEAKFDSMDSHAERQTQILERQTELLQDHSISLGKLVTLAERRR